MKNILAIILLLTTLTGFGQQTWKEFKTEDGIKVVTSVTEFHDNSKDIHQEFITVKVINTLLVPVDFFYTIETTYNGLTSTYNSDKDNHIYLSPGEDSIADSIFVRFLPNVEGRVLSETVLNNFDITITNN